MRLNHKIILSLLFISMVGICAGAFFEVYITGDIKDQLSAILDAYFSSSAESAVPLSAGDSFVKAVKSNTLFIALAIISPFIIITAPLLPLLILLKGIAAGFSAAVTLETFGVSGITHILIYILPQNLLQITAYCILTGIAANVAIIRGASILISSSPALHRKRKALRQDARQYLFYYLLFITVIILSCLLEAFLLQLKL